MKLAVTIKRDEDVERIKLLVEALRKVLSSENVTVLEAPTDLDYAYPFPVVTVSEGPEQGRHFGSEALEVLQAISAGR
jgi:hypothetical protein